MIVISWSHNHKPVALGNGMHGGATWNSSVNRAQVRDGQALLARVLPVMLGAMMDNPARFEGRPFYPVVQS